MSSITVSDIKISSVKIELPEKYATAKKLLPSVPHNNIKFILHKVYVELANAIRRTAVDEKCCIALSFDPQSMITDTENFKHVIPEQIVSRIGLLPLDQALFDQHIDTPDNLALKQLPHFELDIYNKSANDYAMITSKDIRYKVVGSKSRSLPFPTNVNIVRLPPSCHVRVPDIEIVAGYGFEHPKFMPTVVQFSKLKYQGEGEGLVTDPYNFTTTNGDYEFLIGGANVNPQRYVYECIEELLVRVQSAEEELLKGIQQLHEHHFEFRLSGETSSIGCLFSRYIYEADPTIESVASYVPHPANREVVLVIKAKDAINRLKAASISIQRDLTTVGKYFK